METTIEETQHLVADAIPSDPNFDCGTTPGPLLDPADVMLNETLVPFVVDGVPKTASTPVLTTAQIHPNDAVDTPALGDIAASRSTPSPKTAENILGRSVDPLPVDHSDNFQSTLQEVVASTTPNLPTSAFDAEDNQNSCLEIVDDCPLTQSTPCPVTDDTLSTTQNCSALAGIPSAESQIGSDLDTTEAHGSGTSDSGEDGSFVDVAVSSSSSLCSEETSFASSTMDPPVKSNQSASDVGPTEVLVKVPDMLSSIMSTKPVVNPHYFSAKPKIDSWTKKVLGKSQEWSVKNSMVDVTYLAAAWAPSANEDGLILLADWGNWVFIFDDVFDEGILKDDVPAAQKKLDEMMALMNNTFRIRQEDDPLGYIFQSVWDRFMKNSTTDQQQHWRDMHQRYFDGLLQQVKNTQAGQACPTTVDEYLAMRLGTIGADPAIAVIEYVTGVDLPPAVFAHPSVQKLMRISAELVILHNDVISFKKDMDLNVSLNLITLLGTQSSSPRVSIQGALDHISTMLDACYRRWYLALAEMPTWGEVLDREVLRFAEVCRDLALGNLHWSFRSPRYLGIAQGLEVQATGELWLPRLE